MPSSNSRLLKRVVVSESPRMTGVIGVSEAPVSKPRRESSALNRRVFDHSRSSSSGSSSKTRIASRQAAATAGGWEVEKRNGRARWMRTSRRAREPATYPPSTPTALDNVPTWMATRPWRPKWSTVRSEEHTSELQSHHDLVCRLLLEKKKNKNIINPKLKIKQNRLKYE